MSVKSMGYFNQFVNFHSFLYSGVRNFVKLVTSAASNVVLMKELKWRRERKPHVSDGFFCLLLRSLRALFMVK